MSAANEDTTATNQGKTKASKSHLKSESIRKLVTAIQPIDTTPEIDPTAVGNGFASRKLVAARYAVNRPVANIYPPSTPKTRETQGRNPGIAFCI